MIKTISVPQGFQQERPSTPDVPGFTPWYDLCLVLHLAKHSSGDILEIGCNQGSTTYQLAKENPGKQIFGVDWTGAPTVCPGQLHEQAVASAGLGKAVIGMPNVQIRDVNSRLIDYRD